MSNRARPTNTYLDTEARLGSSLAAYVGERRAAGKSWRAVARDLARDTGVDLTDETLRVWFVVRGISA